MSTADKPRPVEGIVGLQQGLFKKAEEKAVAEAALLYPRGYKSRQLRKAAEQRLTAKYYAQYTRP